MAGTKEQVVSALREIEDPELRRDIVGLNMVQSVEVETGRATVGIKLPRRAGRFKEQFRAEAVEKITALGLEPEVSFSIELAGGATPEAGGTDASASNNPLPNVKHIIAVGAGKGGVGKSTVSVNLAVGLARAGAKVGLMDGDIYGPSLPTMLGTDRYQVKTISKMIVPFELHGIKAMTIGALVEDDKPLIWRGPMAHGAFQQLATQTDWGELDYLIIDLPPGTGDVPLTMSQLLPLTGAIVVCTPQKVAQDDAKRAIQMFRQLNVEVLGLVENMSYFIGDDGKEYDLFGKGGAEMLAQQAGVPFLGAVPINMNLRRNGDAGDPTANYTGDDQLAKELDALTRAAVHHVSVHVMSGAAAGPTLTIS
ncbi:Mrp/NBP35 family ATP-binding protein [Algisphaera agarilytica]|uniref:Iron-sulfur cluster carrier protein n=1 Tax=Algisphaera agarilytica TaxID=1385975 RepID=A0A7X0HAJ5_9BACT|nr:Mrp/NBP35 family ATP-binding protein [Algisphaera agarilytica]MBB6431166.1 ATP-binding protein involved in chromosome partitioning [Algisphaera agarilytica]